MKKIKKFITPLSFLFAVLFYILFGALSYQSAHMHYENINDYIPASLSKNGNSFTQIEDYKNLMNMTLFETNQPRYTRPLSNLMMMLNHKMRSKYWNKHFPHPTLSLFLIFPLFLTPLFLYLSLNQWGLSKEFTLGLMAYYLAGPFSLESFVETFRPGKMMINFLFFFFWYVTQKKIAQKRRDMSIHKKILFDIFYFSFLYLSFYWDETFLVVWASLFVLFFSYWRHNLVQLALFLLAPVLYLLAISICFPHLAKSLNYIHLSFGTYHVLQAWPVVIKNFFSYYFVNAYLIGIDLLGIHSPFLPQSVIGKTILSLNLMFLSLVVISGLLFLRKNHYTDFLKKNKKFVCNWFLVFVILIALHNALMISVNSNIFGIFYYGAFMGPIMVLFISQVLNRFRISKKFVWSFLLFVIPAMIYKFHYLNLSLKYNASNIAKGGGTAAVFLDQMNRYEISQYQVRPVDSWHIRQESIKYWRFAKNHIKMLPEYYHSDLFEYRYIFLETPKSVNSKN